MEGPNTGACLLQDGVLTAMAEEERFVRQKMAPGVFPARAVSYCLENSDLRLRDIDVVATGWDHGKYPDAMTAHMSAIEGREGDPLADRMEGLIHQGLSADLAEFSVRVACRKIDPDADSKFAWFGHHESHAASVHYVSGFDESAALVMDGSGEEITTSTWHCRGDEIVRDETWRLPDSLGWFYSAITEWLGFSAYSGEGKVMGLAAYGDADQALTGKLAHFCADDDEQVYRVDPTFVYYGPRTYSKKFTDKLVSLLGTPRQPEAEITDYHIAVAHAAQERLETVALALAARLLERTGSRNLCISGGVAMNCKANGLLSNLEGVDNVFINPASHDSGTALGAALLAARKGGIDPRQNHLTHAYWGPTFEDAEVQQSLDHCGLRYEACENIADSAAALLAENKIVGWFQGRAEVGARALGGRSILANPMDPGMKDKINANVKYREAFRPFAPSLIAEAMDEYMVDPKDSPFMILAYPFKAAYREVFPAVVHVDGSVRPQTVDRATAPLFWDLLRKFGDRTGHPVLLNTSFNVRGEPIVGTPLDAIRCFFSTGMDALAIGRFMVTK